MRKRKTFSNGMTQLEMVSLAVHALPEGSKTSKIKSYIYNTFGARLTNQQVNRAKSFNKKYGRDYGEFYEEFTTEGAESGRSQTEVSNVTRMNKNRVFGGVTLDDLRNIKEMVNRMSTNTFNELVDVVGG